jgi:hypothetical protein
MQQMPTNQPPSVLCAICQTAVLAREEKTFCPECHSPYHSDCWQENGGCALYGCTQVPATEGRAAIEIPAAYWGRENKPCPACGREILAAAVRCRHCGATFSSSRPESNTEFRARSEKSERMPKLRKTAVWLFIFCALPCTALVASLAGLVWYLANREDINSLPSLYSGLCKAALGVGLGQSAIGIIMLLLYSTFRA